MGVFEPCQKFDPKGDHVAAIQVALVSILPNHGILSNELENGIYGPTTAAAVLRFKGDPVANGTENPILGPGQIKPDSIVGKQTIAALDRQLAKLEPGPDVPPKPLPDAGKFEFRPVRAPLLIKFGADDTGKPDLENTPVARKSSVLRAELAFSSVGKGPPTEDNCKKKLLTIIGRGGANARDMAEFFFTNNLKPPGFIREFKGGHFWVKQVEKDPSFTGNQANLSAAIRDALQELADGSPLNPKVVDINKLEDGSSFQPKNFAAFAINIDFSFQRDPKRLLAGDPLAFGFGSIQGVEVRITEFAGQPDGSYKGKLQYVLVDHFGSDDSDVVDPGQASLWLLQRKMANGQGRTKFEPYRVKIVVDDVEFSGQLK